MKKFLLVFSLLSIIPSNQTIYCDIKGSVEKPGVYEIKENYTIQNVIDLAGGLTKDAYTENINLSKKVKDEMVIYISNKKEINKLKSLNDCICTPIYEYKECEINKEDKVPTIPEEKNTTSIITETTTNTKNITTANSINITTTTNTTSRIIDKKININTCTVEELININGLGETKAKKIIEYRNFNGNFNTLDDLLNVDGIGIKTLEKIKEFIEI